MKISNEGIKLIFLLRDEIGKENVGVGPDIHRLIEIWNGTAGDLGAAISELETMRLIKVDRGIFSGGVPVPIILRNIVGISALESLQGYCDNLER